MTTPPKYTQGFTLIELMVVLVIIAVLLGGVTLSLQPAEGQRLQKQVRAFQGLMQTLCDQALLRHQALGLVPARQQPDIYALTLPSPGLFAPASSSREGTRTSTGTGLSGEQPRADVAMSRSQGTPAETVSTFWQKDAQLQAPAWTLPPSQVTVSTPRGADQAFALPAQGWRCFPDTSVDAGSVVFRQGQQAIKLVWNTQQRFEQQTLDPDLAAQ